ncbi:amidohydrolase family protein [Paraburkholderia bonniea]|uniref:amidohydrolase family protein n=1 Tax=Paraburkholderia bonniea TaxID=2152891 RepID=UPI001291409C|nr:amidohydrolase family protein [Paraburkholderia bonniea]WJF90042.1 amidohydrolase family protein [Paraburkholderia bonniea]WJF93356.1 amidohydrolase family protein [Paraburkholderia bonniea]
MHNSHDSSHVRLPLFDAHAHLVADDQTRYPRKPMQRAPNAPPRKPGVIGTPGGKAGPNPVNEIPDVLRMVRWMKEENVEGGVAVQKRMLYRFDNSYILDSSDLYPEVFSAVVILDAEDAGTPALIRQYREQHGLSGVRLFGGREPDGTMPWLNSPSALETWAVANAYGLVMNVEVLATGGGGPSVPAIIELARRFPNVRVVLDHMLEPEVEDDNYGFDARFVPLSAEPNIYFKFTSINLDIYRESDVPAEKALRVAVDLFGADRIMWGSDIGTSSGTYKEMVQRMLDASRLLTQEERRAVLYTTGKAVFIKGGVTDVSRAPDQRAAG